MRTVDTLVIGGGIAGLSAAAQFARHAETVVLEAEDAVGFHASGRSASYCHFGIGGDLVHRLTAYSRERFAEAEAAGDPVAVARTALYVARAGEDEAFEAEARLIGGWAPGLERIAGEALREFVPVLRTGPDGFVAGLLDRSCFRLDSDAMLQGHVRSLREAGGEIVTGAPVSAIDRRGERWVVETPGGSYAAKRLVNAAGAWADAVARLAGVAPLRLRPLRRTIVAFDAPEGIDVSGWPFTKTIAADGFYMLPEGSARLLASPMDETPLDPCDVQPDEIDVATAAWRVEQGTNLSIRRIAHKWSGLRTFAPDRDPVAGHAPDAPGFFWLAGQGGFGLQTSPAMALAAEALLFGLDWPAPLAAIDLRPEMLSPKRIGG